LEALYAILSVDRYTTLEELLELSLPDEVVQKLVGEAFNRLDPSAQKVMQALAVYNRPVSPAAIDYLLQPHLPSIDSALVLNRLVNMHFARREAGRYYLHPADKEYAFSIIPEKDLTTKDTKVTKENQEELTAKVAKKDLELLESSRSLRSLRASRLNAFTQHDLLNRAADYFVQARKPRAEWKKLDDLSAQLSEYELRCEAGDFDTAADVLTDIDFDYLLLWGHYRLMIDFHEKLQGKINDKDLARISIGNLGHALSAIGKTRQAITNYEKAHAMAKETNNRQAEGTWLDNLANEFANLGEARKAIEYHEQALVIAREIGDRENEGRRLGNLASRYTELGQARKAIEFYEQALVIAREIGDRKGECQRLGNSGHAYLSLAENQMAIVNYQQAIQIADEISFPLEQNYSRYGLTQAYLFRNDLVNARATIEAALQYDEPINNHNVTALHGIISLRQGERETAQEAFAKSIAQADEILAKTPDYYSALDAKGLALSGLTICDLRHLHLRAVQVLPIGARGREELLAEAMKTFKRAREIAPHAGVVKSVLRLFDELVKCDEEGILKNVRDTVEGK